MLNTLTWLRSFWNQRSRNPVNGSVSGERRKFQMPSRDRTSRDSDSWGYKIPPVFVRDAVSGVISSIRPTAVQPSSTHCWQTIAENCFNKTNSRPVTSVSASQVLSALVYVLFHLITISYICGVKLFCTLKVRHKVIHVARCKFRKACFVNAGKALCVLNHCTRLRWVVTVRMWIPNPQRKRTHCLLDTRRAEPVLEFVNNFGGFGRILHLGLEDTFAENRFRLWRNGRVHVTRPGRQFSLLLAADVCGSVGSFCTVLAKLYSTVLRGMWTPTPFSCCPFTSPPARVAVCRVILIVRYQIWRAVC
jgi:hypothetical protein